jgi:CHAT domain-containing protein
LDERETGTLTCERIIEGLDLSGTALVNLVACDSGLVRPDKGTEIDGITRAFLCAGTNAVLGSLWPIEDKAARIFSENFYVNLSTTRDPGQALQQTQLACLGNKLGEGMANPSNWAGYILIGEPAKVDQQADIPKDAIVV